MILILLHIPFAIHTTGRCHQLLLLGLLGHFLVVTLTSFSERFQRTLAFSASVIFANSFGLSSFYFIFSPPSLLPVTPQRMLVCQDCSPSYQVAVVVAAMVFPHPPKGLHHCCCPLGWHHQDAQRMYASDFSPLSRWTSPIRRWCRFRSHCETLF